MDLAISTCAIKSTDFEYRGKGGDHALQTERHHKEWTEGMLRHVIAALQGARVVLITDNRTGHAVIGAKLLGLASSPNVKRGVMVEYPNGQRLVTHIFHLGEVIIPLEQVGTKGAKWTALDTYRNERAAATPLFLAKLGGVKPTGNGKWETRVTGNGVVVSYQAPYRRELRDAEPEQYRGYVYREISQDELGVLA
jgi:hypothetical protein